MAKRNIICDKVPTQPRIVGDHRMSSVFKENKMCLQIVEFPVEWEKNILNLLSENNKRKNSIVVKSTLKDVKDMYINDMQEFAMKTLLTSSMNIENPNSSDHTKCKSWKKKETTSCKAFSKHCSSLAQKYFLCLEPVKIIIKVAQLKLPRVICNFKHYHTLALLTLNDFQNIITNDIKKGSLAITNQFYTEICRVLTETKNLRDLVPRKLTNIMRCITNIFVQQIINVMIKSIDHIINVMAEKYYCPQIKLRLILQNGELHVDPSTEEIFSTYHDIIDNIENIAQDLIPLEEWLNIKATSKYIKVKLPKWYVAESHKKLQTILNGLFQSMNDHIAKITEEFYPVCAAGVKEKISSLTLGKKNFDLYLKHIKTYNVYLTKANAMVANSYYKVGKLEQNDAKEALKKQSFEVVNTFLIELIKYHQEFNRNICIEFEELKVKALNVPKDAKSLMELCEYMSHTSNELLIELRNKIQESVRMLSALLEITILTDDHIELNVKTINWLQEIQPVLDQNNTLSEAMKSELEDNMQNRINLLNSKVDDITPQLCVLDDMDDVKRIPEYIEYYKTLLKQVNQIDHDMQMINEEESLFKFPETEFPKIVELKDIIMSFHALISNIHQWQKDNGVWLDGPFEWLDAKVIQKKTMDYFEKITETSKTFKTRIKMDVSANKCFKFSGIADDPDPMQQPTPLKLCWQTLNDINDFKKYLPLVICMCNPALQNRHWKQMSTICNFDLTPNAGSSLRKIFAFDLMHNIEKYEAISLGANRELELQQQLSKMIKEWDEISFEICINAEFNMMAFKNLDDIELLLGEHITKIEEMKASNFVKPITMEVTEFYSSLMRIQEIINQWESIQLVKLSLDPIFSYPDIEKYLPDETAFYAQAKDVLSFVQDKLSKTNFKKINDSTLLESMHKSSESLEKASKAIQDYVNIRRLRFPRFFFLSIREIQDILFKSNNIEELHVPLKKCFEGIHKLRTTQNKYISSILSDCGEELHLYKSVLTNVDLHSTIKWLICLENEIIDTVRKRILEYHQAIEKETIQNDIINFPSMAIICARQLCWTSEVHSCLAPFNPAALKSLYDKYTNQLASLISEMKNSPLRIHKNILTSLIILVTNQKEIIELLLDKSISRSTDFEWVAQLRYYVDNNSIKVSMFNATIKYGFEYGYFKQPVVNTALTDRCFHVLMQAYKYHLYGAITGPPATGKTETVRSLAKAIGRQFRTFNCTHSFSYYFLSDILKGFVSCGAWLCFENFDSIKIEVLSAITQKIARISQSVKSNLSSVKFEKSQLSLDPSGHICVIMRLGQIGYTNLPENLKILFRTISMMAPDIRRIAEIELFSGGFSDSKFLALKLITLYKILSEHLWCKSCNDFGISSIKTVVRTAIYLKRNFTDENETMLLLRSLIDVNLPKLCNVHVLTFKSIVHDMFPGIVLLPPNYTDFLEALETVCKNTSLRIHDIFKLKIIQAFELMYVHRALILVSDPFGGKTEILHTLFSVLSYLHSQDIEAGVGIKLETIMPGVASENQLFGHFSGKSGIWKDGVCSKVFRSFSEDDSFDKKWIVFDGPLKGAWIEHLYTVLDTNRILYLTSGERINMTDSMSIVFETMNIVEASPAILSRCGIIYIESRSIDWRPYAKSYVSKNDIYKGYEKILQALFDWTIEPCFQFVRRNCTLTINVGQLHFVMSILNLFEMLLTDANAENTEEKGKTNQFIIWSQAALLSSIAWGIGGNLNMDSQDKFNSFCITLWSGANKEFVKPDAIKNFDITLPNEGLIQDNFYIFKGIGNWKYFGDLLKTEKILEMPDYNQIFVPTITTLKYDYLLLKHIKCKKSFILCGDVSVGKTCFIKNLFNTKLQEDKYLSNMFSFTSLNTIESTQKLLLSKLNKIRSRYYGPPKTQYCINFIDDLNAENNEDKAGINSILELLRQYFNYGYFYDTNEPEKIFVRDVMFSLAVVTPSRADICPRLLRYFNIYTMYPPPSNTIFRIFSNVLFANLKRNLFAADVLNTVTSITNATIDVYHAVIKALPPVPTKFQYCFNIRDIGRVIGGCSLLQKESVETKVIFIRLWAHETWRVFGDRILDTNDKECLFSKIREIVKKHFKDSFESAFDYLSKSEDNEITMDSFNDLMFGNFMQTGKTINKKYEAINSMETLKNKIMYYLNEYNKNFKKRLDIVVSRYMLECLMKISRILATPGENLLMISSAGSGRRCVTKLAAFMQQQKLFEPSVHSYCDLNLWRADLKMALRECGESRKDVTYFLTDHQTKNSFFRDIKSLLATGDIPDLFSIEDRRGIIEKMRLHAQCGNRNAEISIRSVMNYFVEQCRSKLHVILCSSPTNGSNRSYLYTHSEVMKHCTINLYETWPKDALVQISAQYIQSVNIHEDMKAVAIQACTKFYDNSREMSVKYYQETGRKTHITSAAFLRMLKSYTQLMFKKQEEIITTRNRYLAGLEKLGLAAQQVEQMKATLTILKPKLELSAQQTMITMKKVETENVTVERATILVKEEEEIANKKAAIAGTLKTECEADLAVAIPILEDAVAALNTLKPTDITLVKAMKNPPDTVKLVMAAVCVMLNVPPDRTVDPVTGKKYTDYWGPSKRILGDMNFLQNLKEYDKDNIPSSVMQIIKKTYMTDNSFRPHIVAKASSAAEGLCKWVRAMESYNDVAKVVAPKKEKLLGAQTECDEAEAFLNEKRRTLAALNAKLATLNNSLQETLQQKLKLEKEVEDCTGKLMKAENLIASLGGEKSRWMQSADNLQTNYDNLVGDMLLSCGVIAYMAPYNVAYRDNILERWKEYIEVLKIPYTKDFNIASALGEENEINHWYFNGLPKNKFSTENAIIMSNSKSWCLFIDSQNQANRWIKKIEKKNDLEVVKVTDVDYVSVIQRNLESGKPTLIENIEEKLDILLDPFLRKNIYKDGDTWYLDTGRHVIEYSHNFRLYITTRLVRPNYSYEIFSKVTIIDFSIPNEALQERLLDIVMSKEKLELQEKFETLLMEDAANKKILKQQEDNMLSTLSSTTTNILDDEVAISTLDASKNLSLSIIKKQETAKAMTVEIKKFRETYVQFVKHCVGLFNTLNDLAYLSHMYRFSFSWFIQLYVRSIETSNRSPVVEKRLAFLKTSFTQNLHSSVCRSLSEKHKILYSFLLYLKSLLDDQQATEDEIKFFMSTSMKCLDSGPNSFPPEIWSGIWSVSNKLPAFHGLADDFCSNDSLWKKYYTSEPLQKHLIPEPWINKLSEFEKLILIKVLRPDKIIFNIMQLIENTMEDKQNYSPLLKISRSYAESSCLTPLIFILPSYTSPLTLIHAYSSAKGCSSKLISLSMGQCQETKAEHLIRNAQREGGWVFLQNCHLVPTHWLAQLEKIYENSDASDVSLEFRLWLSSYPTNAFPISILQNSIKITNDCPPNFKLNMLSLYHSQPISNKAFFEGCPGKDKIFSKLLYGFCLFHIVARERTYFGNQGWNVPYNFEHSDFQISTVQLQDLINSTDCVFFDTVRYLIGECNYGGKIMDSFDRRCLRQLLNHYCNPYLIKDYQENFNHIEQLIPQRCEYAHVIKHIMEIPLGLSPQVFGSNINALITRDTFLASELFSFVSRMNPTILPPIDENSVQEQVLILVEDISNKLPDSIVINEKNISESLEHLERFILREATLLNRTLKTIKDSLNNLKLAFNGCILLTESLKEMMKKLSENKVPNIWNEFQNVVTENLSYYLDNLLKSVRYIRNWMNEGCTSGVVYFDALFSCKMFLSAILLTFSKRNGIPIEEVAFDFKITTSTESFEPNDGCTFFVIGLHLFGARWNFEKNLLEESAANSFSQEMPPICLKCKRKETINIEGFYECPVYVTINLNSEINLENYIISIPLKTEITHTRWIQCGAALFCHGRK